jgi:glycosyltransferase involved in cell wall biosynthesis/SAM-dependent methyltransferase
VDGVRYAHWILGDGVKQAGIPHELLPRLKEIAAAVPSSAPAQELTAGVNVAGYFRAELGIGEAARLLVGALRAQGVPYATTTYGATISRQQHVFYDLRPHGAAYDINVVCVNADSARQFAQDIGEMFFAGRHTAGFWFWEVERFPSVMHAAFDVVDEVWTATDFVASAVRAAGRKPVFTVPLPVVVPVVPKGMTRDQLGLPDRFTFLQIFDFSSIMERKNPHGLIEAFTRAFSPNEGPLLVLKAINGERWINERERLRAAAGNRSDIVIIDTYFSPEEKNALLQLCDCYVSLHRSEGLGLTMAEAMALGRPVIATGYSGNLHFMTPANSYLVNYVMSKVPAGCDPYPETASWAEPDLDQAAQFMREVYERPAGARTRAERGRVDVLQHHNLQSSGAAIAARLESIRSRRRESISVPSTTLSEISAPVAAATPPTFETRLPQLEQFVYPTLSADGRPFPTFRLAAQRALFRTLRPYWFQQARFRTELLAAVQHVAAGLRESQTTLDDRLQELMRELHSAKSQVATMTGSLTTSAAAQVELKERQGRNDRRLEGVEARIGNLSRPLIALQERTSQIEVLANSQTASEIFRASADARLEQLTGALQNVEASVAATGTFQTHAAAHLQQLTTALQNVEASIAASGPFQTSAAAHLAELTTALQRVEISASASASFQTSAADHLEQLTTAVQSVEASVAELSTKLFSAPYIADPDRFRDTDASGRQRLGYRTSAAGGGPFYLGFQEMFRGPEALIRDRQRVYLPLLEAGSDVVDIGCGRGEMLDLLREVHVSALGVDNDPDMIRRCRAKGHCVEQVDALSFLRGRPTGSLGAIFTAQVIEHFAFDVLKEFLALCRSRLKPCGRLIAETVNPHALEAFKTFHTDLTHQRPIFPEVALAFCQLSGFEQAYIMFPLGSDDLEADRQSRGEYAVVATAGSAD